MEAYMVWIWLAVFLITVVLEAATQEFVSIWFAVGALIALILSVIPGIPFWVEIIVFSIVSCLALILTRPLVKKMMERSIRYTNVDELVGKRVRLEKTVTKYDAGEVKLNGVIYSAVLMEDVNEAIEASSIVEIVAFKGNKIVVKKINQKEENVVCF